MSVIRAVGDQWKKAQYADQLARFFRDSSEVRSLFVGATDISTVCYVIAALSSERHRLQASDMDLDSQQVFLALFDCFLLLFIKEIQGNELSQAEQLTLTLTRHYAQQSLDDELNLDKELSLAHDSDAQVNSDEQVNFNEEVKLKSERVLNASVQLDAARRQRRHSRSNMGRVSGMGAAAMA